MTTAAISTLDFKRILLNSELKRHILWNKVVCSILINWYLKNCSIQIWDSDKEKVILHGVYDGRNRDLQAVHRLLYDVLVEMWQKRSNTPLLVEDDDEAG